MVRRLTEHCWDLRVFITMFCKCMVHYMWTFSAGSYVSLKERNNLKVLFTGSHAVVMRPINWTEIAAFILETEKVAPSGLHIPLANKKTSGLFLEGNTNPFGVVSGRAQKIIKEQHSYICAIETLEINCLLAFSLWIPHIRVCLQELYCWRLVGNVSTLWGGLRVQRWQRAWVRGIRTCGCNHASQWRMNILFLLPLSLFPFYVRPICS